MAAPVTTTQLFSRRGLGFLWNSRNELDPGQVAIINSLYNNRKKNGEMQCQQSITYKLSNKKAGKLGWGRLYGNMGSLETIEKECRGTLCQDYYHDLDIVNCHYVLLEQFARNKYQKDLPELSRYVSNREEFLKELGGSRDEAKEALIKILYGGSCKNEFLMPLSAEARAFSKFLSREKEYEELFNACKSQDCVFGSFLSFILQTEERKCMLAMKASLETLGWKVDVLAYDGVMIRKDPKLELAAAIKACEDGIKEATGYCVSVVNKEMMSFKIPELTEELCKNVTREMYDAMKTKFELTNFYYAPSNEMIEVQGRQLMRMGLEHAREYYSRKWRFEHSQKFEDFTTFFDVWRKDRAARSILKIDMRESEDPSVFVMPPKFAWQDEGSCAPQAVEKFREIMKLIGSSAQQEYIIYWLAQLVQQPFERVGSALVITGEKRTGKDTPFDFFNEFVMGGDYTHNYTCGGSQFFEKHDTNRMNKFLCKVEEANRKIFLTSGNAEKMKTLVTAKDETYNDKGRKAVTVANYNRFVLTTNGACPVEMSDGEQRFLIATCSSARKHDIAYWKEVRDILFNKEAGRAVGQWLASLDISGYEFRKIPEDEYQATLVEAETTSEEMFVNQWDGVELAAPAFYQAYRSYCSENELPYCQNLKSLGIQLLKLLRSGKLQKRKTNEGAFYRKA